jgi:hypothetical protein
VQYDVAMILCYVQGETVREVTDLDLHQDMMANMGFYAQPPNRVYSRNAPNTTHVEVPVMAKITMTTGN